MRNNPPSPRRSAARLAAGLLLCCLFPVTAVRGQNAPVPPPSPPGEEDIRGPRDPVVIPVPEKSSLTPWLVAGGILTFSALAAWLWKRRTRTLAESSALDRAREELRAVHAQRSSLEADRLADEAAGVVRRFIDRKFGIAAPRRTTEEFLRSVSTAPGSPLSPHTDLLEGFLRSCDMAKFAGARMDEAQRFALLETADKFVQAAAYTAPPEQNPPASPAAA